ncbi:hypothetical protein [Paraburkholderia sp. HD33-4]|uniref:hypothetical protein n=1 Tax=Paraburkholderia sp. HD33-4 TaxID=2883242 RepID=UPI001F3F769F|nr:hypothetical protein [Paraburkholderia sp. HD33-4]
MVESEPPDREAVFDLGPGSRHLSNSIWQLDSISRKMRILGLYAVGLMALLLLLTLMNLSGKAFFLDFAFARLSLFFSIAAALCIFIVLVMRDSLRRRGNALFEELSDELQWYAIGDHRGEARSGSTSRPPLEIRVVLRSYARTTDLPMVPGRYGEAIYMATAFMLVLADVATMTVVKYY